MCSITKIWFIDQLFVCMPIGFYLDSFHHWNIFSWPLFLSYSIFLGQICRSTFYQECLIFFPIFFFFSKLYISPCAFLAADSSILCFSFFPPWQVCIYICFFFSGYFFFSLKNHILFLYYENQSFPDRFSSYLKDQNMEAGDSAGLRNPLKVI